MVSCNCRLILPFTSAVDAFLDLSPIGEFLTPVSLLLTSLSWASTSAFPTHSWRSQNAGCIKRHKSHSQTN